MSRGKEEVQTKSIKAGEQGVLRRGGIAAQNRNTDSANVQRPGRKTLGNERNAEGYSASPAPNDPGVK